MYNRVRDGNFSLEGVAPGWDVKGKTVGVLGTGRIGEAFVRVMVGMGCRVLGYDVKQNPRLLKLQEWTRGVSAGDDDDGGAFGGSFEYAASLEAIWPVRWDDRVAWEWMALCLGSLLRVRAHVVGWSIDRVINRQTALAPKQQVADVISLHLPLTPQTQRLINQDTLAKMKPKVM